MATGAVSAVAKLAAGRHGVFTRKQAATSALKAPHIETAIRRGWLTEPAPGVLVFAGTPPSWRQRLSIITAIGGDHAATSHRAAAVCHRLDGFDDPDALCRPDTVDKPRVKKLGKVKPEVPVEVTVLQPRTLALPPGLTAVVHQANALDDCDLVSVDHIRCTGLARTLVDLGAVCSDDAVWNALISARRIHDINPAWLQETARRLERPGPTGTRAIRRALKRWADQGVLPDSWLEELMLRMLSHPSVPEVIPQFVVHDAEGKFVAIVDAAIPAARLALEGHSREHHFGPVHEAADEDRDLRLAAAGFETLYLGWYATLTPEQTLAKILPVIKNRVRLFTSVA